MSVREGNGALSRVRATAVRVVSASTQGPRIDDLEKRVKDLEDELLDAHRLVRRLAELMDVVEELLVPIAQRDDAKVQELLDRYVKSL